MTRAMSILFLVVAFSGCVESLPLKAKLLAAHQDCTVFTESVAHNVCIEGVLERMEVQEREYKRRVDEALSNAADALQSSTKSNRSSVTCYHGSYSTTCF